MASGWVAQVPTGPHLAGESKIEGESKILSFVEFGWREEFQRLERHDFPMLTLLLKLAVDYLAAVDSWSIQVLTVDLQKPVEIHGVGGVAALFLDGLGGAGDLSLSYQSGDVVLQFAVARHVFIEGVHEFRYIAVAERGRHGGENIDDVAVGVGEEASAGDNSKQSATYDSWH